MDKQSTGATSGALALNDLEATKRELSVHLANRKPEALNAVLPALNAHPNDAELLLMAVTAALLDELP